MGRRCTLMPLALESGRLRISAHWGQQDQATQHRARESTFRRSTVASTERRDARRQLWQTLELILFRVSWEASVNRPTTRRFSTQAAAMDAHFVHLSELSNGTSRFTTPAWPSSANSPSISVRGRADPRTPAAPASRRSAVVLPFQLDRWARDVDRH